MAAVVRGGRQAARTTDTAAFCAVVAFSGVMYTVPGEWIAGTEVLRLALVTSGMAAALLLVQRLGRLEAISLDGLRGAALLGFVVLSGASIAWSINPEVSQKTAIDLAKLAAIYFTMVNVVTSGKRLAILCGALVLASVVTSIGVIRWYQAGVDLVEGFRARWVGVYADPNHMAMDLGLVVPMAVAFLARKQMALWMRLASAVSAGVAVTAIVLSHSRGGFLGLCAAMALWALRERRKLQSAVLAGMLAVGLLVFAPDSFWTRNETVATFHEDASAMGRVYAWEVASRMSIDRPLVGVGAGSFRYAWPLYATPEAKKAYVAHNVFLDVIGELGFVGLFFFLIFAGGAAGGAFAASSAQEHGWLGRAIAASVTGYLVCDLFSGYILSSHLYVLFGLGACAERIARAQPESILLSRRPRPADPVFVKA